MYKYGTRYMEGGGLTRRDHYDEGSVITIVIMLADSETDYEGGRIQTWYVCILYTYFFLFLLYIHP